jgi:F1F0 ATPase subunit 2
VTTSQILILGASGALLGVVFFGGLWWTVRQGVNSKSPGLWFFASLQLRLIVTLVGFYFLIGDHAERVVPSLIGFVISRFAVMAWTKKASFTHQSRSEQEDA